MKAFLIDANTRSITPVTLADGLFGIGALIGKETAAGLLGRLQMSPATSSSGFSLFTAKAGSAMQRFIAGESSSAKGTARWQFENGLRISCVL